MSAPQSGSEAKAGDLKTSQRVAANIMKYKQNTEPIFVDPDEILVDECNRMHSAPNILICHQVLAPSFKHDGYDPNKPPVGVCRLARTTLALIEWNFSFSAGDERFPPIVKQKADKGSLACTHVNVTGRMFKHGMTTQDGLRLTTEGDTPLQEFVRIGHKWWVLDGNTPDDVATEISSWHNSGNNSAQVWIVCVTHTHMWVCDTHTGWL